MNIRVEYDSTPIRNIAVQCPNCEKWFYGYDITEDKLQYSYQVPFAKFHCPVCSNIFGCNVGIKKDTFNVKEYGSAEEVYKGCLEKKVSWE